MYASEMVNLSAELTRVVFCTLRQIFKSNVVVLFVKWAVNDFVVVLLRIGVACRSVRAVAWSLLVLLPGEVIVSSLHETSGIF